MGEVACAVCRDTGELQDSQAWDCGQSNSECPYCPHKVDEYRKEIAALREAVRWYHGYEVKGWPEFPVEMVVGKRYVFRSVARENSDTVRRALKEKP